LASFDKAELGALWIELEALLIEYTYHSLPHYLAYTDASSRHIVQGLFCGKTGLFYRKIGTFEGG